MRSSPEGNYHFQFKNVFTILQLRDCGVQHLRSGHVVACRNTSLEVRISEIQCLFLIK